MHRELAGIFNPKVMRGHNIHILCFFQDGGSKRCDGGCINLEVSLDNITKPEFINNIALLINFTIKLDLLCNSICIQTNDIFFSSRHQRHRRQRRRQQTRPAPRSRHPTPSPTAAASISTSCDQQRQWHCDVHGFVRA